MGNVPTPPQMPPSKRKQPPHASLSAQRAGALSHLEVSKACPVHPMRAARVFPTFASCLHGYPALIFPRSRLSSQPPVLWASLAPHPKVPTHLSTLWQISLSHQQFGCWDPCTFLGQVLHPLSSYSQQPNQIPHWIPNIQIDLSSFRSIAHPLWYPVFSICNAWLLHCPVPGQHTLSWWWLGRLLTGQVTAGPALSSGKLLF